MTQADSAVAAVDPALREQVVDSICALLPQVLKRKVIGASADTTLMEALGMSSTSALELILELEERLELEISVEDLGRDPPSQDPLAGPAVLRPSFLCGVARSADKTP
jgi:acyl carrier protein